MCVLDETFRSEINSAMIIARSLLNLLPCFCFPYVQCVGKVAKYIQQQNRDVYEPRGIVIGDPMDRGLRCVS